MTAASLRKLREKLGLSQAEMAKKVGTSQATISRWETGDSAISRPVQALLKLLFPKQKP